MIKISIANMKGGVGKSTTAMMLADVLSLKHNLEVLVVDCDPQSNLSQMFLSYSGLKKASAAEKTICHWMQSKLNSGVNYTLSNTHRSRVSGLVEFKPSNSFRRQITKGQVGIWPSIPELRFAELAFDHKNFVSADVAQPGRILAEWIKAELVEQSRTYDVVIFDCPPGFSTLAQAAIRLSDAIISPVNVDPVSVWSLKQFWERGLDEFLDLAGQKQRFALLTMTSRSAGGKDEKLKFRQELREFAKNGVLSEEIPFSVQALRFGRRISLDSHKSFKEKYGKLHLNLERLGKEVESKILKREGDVYVEQGRGR